MKRPVPMRVRRDTAPASRTVLLRVGLSDKTDCDVSKHQLPSSNSTDPANSNSRSGYANMRMRIQCARANLKSLQSARRRAGRARPIHVATSS